MAQRADFATSDGVSLVYEQTGDGPACLYIHGGPGSGYHWAKTFSGSLFEQRFHMVYMDQRGCGLSTSPAAGDYSIERMVADFEELRKSLGIEHWYIMGHSFAGVIMTEYANRHPDSIDGMLMICCTLDISESLDWQSRNLARILGHEALPALKPGERPDLDRFIQLGNEARSRGLWADVAFGSNEFMDACNATYREFPNWNGDLSESVMSLPEYLEDKRPLSPAINVPVLFFSGRNDGMVGPDGVDKVRFPQMLVWESSGGHFPFMDDPQGLQSAIDSFIRAFPRP
ncbi:MAG: alpha/beta hydrolase [Opitutales bacterium]|nr:alpha/beta hydrolase [Opitutales bacterium]